MFINRYNAGERLAEKLKSYKGQKDTLVVGIARGGIVVAGAIADSLLLPLGSVVVKKIGAPGQRELALGAISPEKTVFWEEEIVSSFHITEAQKKLFAQKTEKERLLLEKELGIEKMAQKFAGKTILLVDDGIATGATVLAAQKYLRKKKVSAIILGVPVISTSTLRQIKPFFDKTIALEVLEELRSVGQFYEDFSQVESETVRKVFGNGKLRN